LGRARDRVPVRRITNRLRIGILRAKWLTKLEEEEDLGILTRFEERYTKGCNDTVIRRYFLMDRAYTLKELYQKWYRQRHNNE